MKIAPRCSAKCIECRISGSRQWGQTGPQSAIVSGRALPSEADAQTLEQHETPSLFMDFYPPNEHHEEPTYITNFDDTNSETKYDYDIGADLETTSPAHIWMRELELNFEGA